MASYWIISVPSDRAPGERKEEKISSEERKRLEKNTRDRLNKATTGYATNYPFRIPNLKVGTLDKLMAISDKLGKVDTMVEAISKKIERSFSDFWKADPSLQDESESKGEAKSEVKGQETPELKVESKTPQKYLEEFQWNAIRYNPKRDLNDLLDTILEAAHKADDSLKKQSAEFTEVKQALTAIERRETGTLLVKPLGPFVSGANAKYIVEKEYITTLLVVVPKAKEKNWQEEYEILEDLAAEREAKEREKAEAAKAARAKKQKDPEKAERKQELHEGKEAKSDERKEEMSAEQLEAAAEAKRREEGKQTCKNVVPRSAVRLTPADYDGEFHLYRILVFKKGADTIKNLCRERRYMVRPFVYDPKEEKEATEEKKKLIKQKKKLWNFLIRWAKTTYSDVFSSWIHIKAMRVFCESVLRFGLPIDFHATVVEPRKGKEHKLRQLLKEIYQNLPNAALAEGVEGEQDLSGLGTEFYPYVYFSIIPTAQ